MRQLDNTIRDKRSQDSGVADVYKRQIHEFEGKRIRLECDGPPVRLSLDSCAGLGVFVQIQLEDKTKELGENLSSCARRRTRVT